MRKTPKTNKDKVKPKDFWIYGKFPVLNAILKKDRQILSLIITEASLKFLQNKNIDIEQEAENRNFRYKLIDNTQISKILGYDIVHQGIAAQVTQHQDMTLAEILKKEIDSTKSTILLLDYITDPYNVGSIIRSAAAFGAAAVIITNHNAPSDNFGIISKASSGMLECIPLIRVSNLVNTIERLKECDYWIVGMDINGSEDIKQISDFNKIAIVLGSEGDGMRSLTIKKCDFLIRIPISHNASSLNVSNAAAIALYQRSSTNK